MTCGKPFSQAGNLKIHIRTIHEGQAGYLKKHIHTDRDIHYSQESKANIKKPRFGQTRMNSGNYSEKESRSSSENESENVTDSTKLRNELSNQKMVLKKTQTSKSLLMT